MAPLNGNGRVAMTDKQVSEIVTNVSAITREMFVKLLDPRRSINDECGYPPSTTSVDADVYRELFDSDAIANRVVRLMPDECWQVTPTVYETEDATDVTDFEKAWDELEVNLAGGSSYHQDERSGTIWEYLHRVDVLSGIGKFGVLLLGIDDGKNLQEPVEGVVALNRRDVPIVNAAGMRIGTRVAFEPSAGAAVLDCAPTAGEASLLKQLVENPLVSVAIAAWDERGRYAPRREIRPAEALNSYTYPTPAAADLDQQALKDAVVKLVKSEYPRPMPGYGEVYAKGRDVLFIGGDGDEDGYEALVKDTLRSVPGIGIVTYQAEGVPKGGGWKLVVNWRSVFLMNVWGDEARQASAEARRKTAASGAKMRGLNPLTATGPGAHAIRADQYAS